MKTTPLKIFGAVLLTLFQSCTLVDHAPRPTGSAMFWNFGVRGGPVDVFVDGKKAGTLTAHFRILFPECGADFTVNVDNLTEGVHTYVARETGVPDPIIFTGSITIVAGQCTKTRIYYEGPF